MDQRTRALLRSLPALLAAGCTHGAQTLRPGEPAAAVQLAVATPQTTPAGNPFTAPAGWSVQSSPAKVQLEAPEGDTHVALVDVPGGDADAAVAAAWAGARTGKAHPLKLASARPARGGWDERKVYDYETSPAEKLGIEAQAFRKGAGWTVLLLETSESTYEKRLADFALLFDTIHPKGWQKETFAGRKAHPLDPERVRLLGQFIEEAQKQLGVPGVALTLLDQGKPVFEGGFGLRELGKPEPVDADTLFLVASNTKAMTTLLLAELVDQHKIAWDTKVSSVLPGFKLGDAATTQQVEVRHLVCACTGLPRQDLEWLFEFKDNTPATTMQLLGTMQPTSRFGEIFQYSNVLAAAGGFLGGWLAHPELELGAAYDLAMRERVFGPLGMKSATFDLDAALRQDHATGHGDDPDGKPGVVVMDLNRSIRPLRPAGGAWVSARELGRYVALELSKGRLPDGTVLVSEENLLARRKKQVTIGENTIYGMGLETDTTWGVPVVHHGGSMIGYKTDMMLLPEQGVGAVLLTNSDTGQLLLRPFLRRLLEVLFDGTPEAAEDVVARAQAKHEAQAAERPRLTVPADPALVAQLSPHYRNAALGNVHVQKRGAQTVFDFDEWSSAVASRKNDDGSISFVTVDPGADGFEFVVGKKGDRRTLSTRDAQHEYVFDEK